MSTSTQPKTGVSISRLRTFILIALVAGASVFTGVMFTLVHHLSERFGPQVQADLDWRAERGAQELAKTADLGLAVSDEKMVRESFGVYATSHDVKAIIAVDASGTVVAKTGDFRFVDSVFDEKSGELVRGPGYVASWAPAIVEGATVGKVAVVVSTARMSEASATLSDVERTTVISGAVGLVLGCLVILFFTRAVSIRDKQLNDYAANLERKVDERTAELDERNRGMRLVLDNVAQGFITIDPDGVMANERSAIVETWFGKIAPDSKFSDTVRKYGEFATWFELGLDSLREGIMPIELSLSQMPKRFVADGRTFEVAYQPICDEDEKLQRMLLIVSDVSAEIERERTEREQREIVELFQRISADRAGFDEFYAEAAEQIVKLREPGDPAVEKRLIHTLKGNCGVYGISSFAEVCHEIETELSESGGGLSDVQRGQIDKAWAAVVARLSKLLGEQKQAMVEVDRAELTGLVERVQQGVSKRDLAAKLATWLREPVSVRFQRLGRQATGLGRRLGKARVDVAIDDGAVRLDAHRWHGFWSAMIHAVRNAVDHGVETADERETAGKPAHATLTLSAKREPASLEIQLADDGRGIDWEAVRGKATRVGLPSTSHSDLVAALFHDGFSTRDAATDVSGRGVGLGALRAEVEQAGGTVDVTSQPGKGTTFSFRFPVAADPVELRPPTQPILRVS